MYRWIDHTAEVELAIEAESERAVLADAVIALAELLCATEPDPPSQTRAVALTAADRTAETRTVAVSAPDRPALLAAWLEELVFLAESEGFVATSIEQLDLFDDRLRAVVRGSPSDPPPLVKAVTYHRLTFEPAGPGYVASVVLDV